MNFIQITPETLSALRLDEHLVAVEDQECFAYSQALSPAVQLATSDAERTSLQFVVAVLMMSFRPWDAVEPFGAMWSEGRSVALVDLPKNWLISLCSWASNLGSPELRSRFLDLLWVRGRDVLSAKLAVNAYLESAKLLTSTDQVLSAERYERALRLAISLGKGAVDERKLVLQALDFAVLSGGVGECGHLVWKLVPLLLEFRFGDAGSYGRTAKCCAHWMVLNKQFWVAKDMFTLAANCFRVASNAAEMEDCERKAAESLVSESESALAQSRGVMVASSVLAQAINLFRQTPGGKARAEELHPRLLALQSQSILELSAFSTRGDASKLIKKAISAVDGKPLREAITTLCSLGKSPNVQDLIAGVRKRAQIAVLGSLAPMEIINVRGQVVAKAPGLEAGMDDIRAPGLRARAFQYADECRTLAVQEVIDPVRRCIEEQHAPSRQEILELIASSPWVPPEKLRIFCRALLSGFYLDMEVAAHLVPIQLEALVRHVVRLHGGVTTMLDAERLQQERPLNSLLGMVEAEKAFGVDGVLELQDLLAEPIGSNLRNEAGHGLLSDGECYSPNVLYAWWVLLHYVVLPGVRATQEEANA